MRSIVAALMLFALSACCGEAHRLRRPERPALEHVAIRQYACRSEKGDVLEEVWVIRDPRAFQKNLERTWAYIYALEAAPFWEGPAPPRLE